MTQRVYAIVGDDQSCHLWAGEELVGQVLGISRLPDSVMGGGFAIRVLNTYGHFIVTVPTWQCRIDEAVPRRLFN